MSQLAGPTLMGAGSQVMAERNQWSDAYDAIGLNETTEDNWVKDFEEHKATEGKSETTFGTICVTQSRPFAEVKNEEFNQKFWEHLKEEWKKRRDESEEQPPWLSEFNEFYDPYKVRVLNRSQMAASS